MKFTTFVIIETIAVRFLHQALPAIKEIRNRINKLNKRRKNAENSNYHK